MGKSAKTSSANTLDLETTTTTEEVTKMSYADQIKVIDEKIVAKAKELDDLKNEKNKLIILERVESGDVSLINRLLSGESAPKRAGVKKGAKVAESQVLECMDGTPISATDIAKKLNVEVKDVSAVLKALVTDGKVKSEGKARGVKYTIA